MDAEITPQRAARWIATAPPLVRRELRIHYASLLRAEDSRFDVEAFGALVQAEIEHLRAEVETLFPPPSDS